MADRVGYIGLGDMGRAMASNLAPKGFATTVYDIDESRVSAVVATGAKAASSPKTTAENADILCICVRTDQQVLDVIAGDDGVLAGLAPGSLIALHSTILPATVHAVAEAAAAVGCRVIDACVTGGGSGAERGILTCLAGGAEADIERARPVLEASSKLVVHAGELGNGAKLKIAINLLGYVMFAGAYEAYSLAVASGVSKEAFIAAGRSNGNLSETQEAIIGMHALPAAAVEHGEYQTRMGVQLLTAEKDLSHALELAKEYGIEIPTGEQVVHEMTRIYRIVNPPAH